MDKEFATNLEEVASRAIERVRSEENMIALNFVLKVRFSTDLLLTPQLLDVASKAEAWQSTEVPANMYFTHGQFIGKDGIPHIIQELLRKPDSNRALASLISQEHILGSNDEPLPSFLTIQSSIVANTLYLTTVFRALEVSTFFRINLEEIRLVGERIHRECRNFTTVALCVFAFRAYVSEGINTLERCEIDLLSEGLLIKTLEKQPRALVPLIRAKAKHTTAADPGSIRTIANILASPKMSADIRPEIKSDRLRTLAANATSQLEKYATLRVRYSHEAETRNQSAKVSRALEELAREFEKVV